MASWLTVDPIIVTDPAPKLIFEEAGQSAATIRVRVRFTDNTTPTPRTREKDYVVSGPNARTDLAKLVYHDRMTLEGAEGMTTGAITPTAPTAIATAIADYQLVGARLDALTKLQSRLGLADGDVIGTSGVTVTAARTALRNAHKADLTNQTALYLALDNTR